jgi:hypothetical protein
MQSGTDSTDGRTASGLLQQALLKAMIYIIAEMTVATVASSIQQPSSTLAGPHKLIKEIL